MITDILAGMRKPAISITVPFIDKGSVRIIVILKIGCNGRMGLKTGIGRRSFFVGNNIVDAFVGFGQCVDCKPAGADVRKVVRSIHRRIIQVGSNISLTIVTVRMRIIGMMLVSSLRVSLTAMTRWSAIGSAGGVWCTFRY